jgi:leucyl-tRNA synthetase
LLIDSWKKFIKILYPFVPHICEELWEDIGEKTFLFNEKWPEYEKIEEEREKINIGVQINGRVRGNIEIPSNAKVEEILKIVSENERFKKYIDNKKIIKKIYIERKLINIVVED